MKRITALKKVIRVVTIYLVMIGSISFPMQISALDGDTTRNITGILNYFGQQVSQLQNMQYQNEAQMAAMQRAQQLLMANAPSTVISSRYFPGCALPPDNQVPPQNVCENLQNPAEIILGQQMAFLGQQQSTFLDIMLKGAGDGSPNNAGIACMDEALKRHHQLFQGKINSLMDYRNRYNKEVQIIKKNLEPLLSKMDDLNYEINGGTPKNEAQKSFNFEKLFTGTACQGIVDASHYVSKKGIRGVQGALTTPGQNGKSLYGNASNVLADQNKLKDQIENQINRLVKEINTYGIDFDIANTLPARSGETMFFEMAQATRDQKDAISKRHQKIKEQLARDFPGYELPAMDQHFLTNIDEFAKDAADYFKKKVVHDCVTMKDKTGIGLTNDQVINLLSFPGHDSNNKTYRSYKTELQDILSRDSFIEDKLTNIKLLDQKFNNKIVVKGSFTNMKRGTPKSPYFVYQAIVNACTNQVIGTNAFTTKSGKRDARSGLEKVEEGKRLVNEIKNLGKNFSNNLVKEIRDRTINCGTGATQTVTNCNTNTLEPGARGFCLNNAINCANRVNSCQALTQKHIDDRTKAIQHFANRYNGDVLAFTAEAERSLNVLRAQVFEDMGIFAKQFPEVTIPLPEDLFVKLPEKKMSPYDVELLGGVTGREKFAFMNELPENIDKLIKSIEKADEDIQGIGKSGGYVDKTRQRLKENQNKWEEFKNLCNEKIAQINEKQAKMQEAAMKKQEEELKKKLKAMEEKKKFCRKYHGLAEMNPGPGCEEVSELADDVDKITMIIRDPDKVQFNLNQFKNLCAKVNNEEKLEKDSKENMNLANLCYKASFDFDGVRKYLINDLIKNAPPHISAENIMEYLEEAGVLKDTEDSKKGKEKKDGDKKDDKGEKERKEDLFTVKGKDGKSTITTTRKKPGQGLFDIKKGQGSDDDSDPVTGDQYFDQKVKALKLFLLKSQKYASEDNAGRTYKDHQTEIEEAGAKGLITEQKLKESLEEIKKSLNEVDVSTSATPSQEAKKNGLEKIDKALGELKGKETNYKEIKRIIDTLKGESEKADPNNPLAGIKESLKGLSEKLQKKVDDTGNSDLQDAKEKLVKKLETSENPCAMLQREVVVSLARTCLKKDTPLSCYNEAEDDAMTKGEGISVKSKKLSNALLEYMIVPIEPSDSEAWKGMGENLQNSCIGEDDLQRNMMNMPGMNGMDMMNNQFNPSSVWGR